MPAFKTPAIPSSEITPRGLYLNRRHFIAGAGAIGLAGIAGSGAVAALKVARDGTGLVRIAAYFRHAAAFFWPGRRLAANADKGIHPDLSASADLGVPGGVWRG